MGWSNTPLLSIGDTVQVSQIAEVRAAIIERRDAVGLSFSVAERAVGDVCIASSLNNYREHIETLIPHFLNEETGDQWTKATLFEHVFGAGRTNWTNKPARDPEGPIYGNTLAAGTVMYVEHLNEMQQVLNELAWVAVSLAEWVDSNGWDALLKEAGAADCTTKASCISAFQNDLDNAAPEAGDPMVGPRAGIELVADEHVNGETLYDLWTEPELARYFCRVTTPDISGGVSARTLLNGIGYSVLDPGTGDPWPTWEASVYYSASEPDPLGSGHWNFGTLLASTNVTEDGSDITFTMDVSLSGNTTYYLQFRGKESGLGALENEDWQDDGTRVADWGAPPESMEMVFLCNFEYAP